MRALLSFIVSTTSFGSSLLARVAAAAEPFNWRPQVDDPIHTPVELVVPTGIETADMVSGFYSKAFRLSAKEERDVPSVVGN